MPAPKRANIKKSLYRQRAGFLFPAARFEAAPTHLALASFWLFGAVAALFLLLGCQSKDIRVQVVDEQGQGLAGAVVYAEAWTPGGGAYDFVYSPTDSQGFAPPAGRSLPRLESKSGARISLAAFAPDKKPTVLLDFKNQVESSVQITLRSKKFSESDWEPKVEKLSYPFPDNARLHQRVKLPDNMALRQAFEKAYHPVVAGRAYLLPENETKGEALRRMREEEHP